MSETDRTDRTDATLYVGDLPFKVTEKFLYEKFTEYGNVLSVHVCRNNFAKQSMVYAYVNFENRFEAKKAMDELNLSNMYGRPCRIMWFEKDSAKRKSGFGNIVIKNLDKSISVREINDVFAVFGKITSCKLKTNEADISTGCAFVNYKSDEDAENAIENMDQKVLGGKIITVERFHVKGNGGKEHLTNCYIDNCPANLDDASLRTVFEKYGIVLIAKIMLDENGVGKGFGFVSFKEPEDAATAIKSLNNTVIHNKTVRVYRVTHQRELHNVCLCVNNLSAKFNDERLRQEFQIFGKIIRAKVMVNPGNNTSLGYGLVSFVDAKDASTAMKAMNGRVIYGKALSVVVNTTGDRPNLEAIKPQIIPIMNFPNVTRPFSVPGWPSNLQHIHPANNLIRPPLTRMYTPPNMNLTPYLPSSTSNNAKQMIGINMYPIVCKYAEDKADQIMTKLLDLDNEELLYIIDDEDRIRIRVLKLMGENETKNGVDINDGEGAEIEDDDNDETYGSSEEDTSSDTSIEDEESTKYKNILRYKLRANVENLVGDMTDDIMRVFIKYGEAELIYMFENDEYLKIKIDEAKKELREPMTDHEALRIKELLGEKIYVIVRKYAGDMAGKITGMLLELDNEELQHLLDNEDLMREKVKDAVELVNEHDTLNDHGKTVTPNILSDITEMVPGIKDGISVVHKENIVHLPLPQVPQQMVNPVVLNYMMNTQRPLMPLSALNIQFRWPINIGPYMPLPQQMAPMMYHMFAQQQRSTLPQYNVIGPSYGSGHQYPVTREGAVNMIQQEGHNDNIGVKQLLGEKIYPLVRKHAGDNAGKITGMFLEMDKAQLLYMIENEEYLTTKIQEALALIEENNAQNSPCVDESEEESEDIAIG